MLTSLKNYLLKKVDAHIINVADKMWHRRTQYLVRLEGELLESLDLVKPLTKEILELPKVNYAHRVSVDKDINDAQLQIYHILRDLRELRAELSLLHESLEHVTKHIGQQTTNE